MHIGKATQGEQSNINTEISFFDVFLTVHRSIDLFQLPTLMHNPFIH